MNGPSDPQNQNDIDTGEPIAELAELKETPPEGFLARIRGSILRRITTAEAIDFSLMALFQTFWEYLSMSIQALAGSDREERER
jgi:hypothetical protein